MTREAAVLVMVAVAAALLGLVAWGWARRVRRDRALSAPIGEIPDGAADVAEFETLYVATTRHDEPLERLAIRGMTLRSRADVTVTDAGVALDLTGRPRLFLASDRIAGVDQATVAIDRVVERDGLTRLSWRADETTVVDTYLRPQSASARALAEAIRTTLTPTTGDDA